jgi:hypothetical protein
VEWDPPILHQLHKRKGSLEPRGPALAGNVISIASVLIIAGPNSLRKARLPDRINQNNSLYGSKLRDLASYVSDPLHSGSAKANSDDSRGAGGALAER